MSELTIKLIIILIPGAIATLIFGKLIVHKEWNSFKFVLFSTLFGFASYLTLQGLINGINCICGKNISELSIWKNLTNSNSIKYNEIILSSLISIIIAFIIGLIENRKVIYHISRFLKVSNKYGEENLYSKFLNSKNVGFVYLRDIKNNLTYHGWVKSFSETDNITEILLSDVAVYKYENSDFLYEVPEIYLSFAKQNLIIELVDINNLNNNNNGEKETNTEKTK